MSEEKVVIVGAGLAGLTAACYLKKAGYDPLILEASDAIGGRVKTDKKDGFLLDRGFQILLPAYPEAKAILNYDQLELCYFNRGAEIYKDGKFIPFYDPGDGLGGLIKTVMTGPATFWDLFKLLRFKMSLANKTVKEIYAQPNSTTLKYLQHKGFSNQLIDTFWKPFFQGIFLEDDLSTDNQLFEFIFKMFIEDGAAIPKYGMGQIPAQLASNLPPERVRCNTSVIEIDGNIIKLEEGNSISACG